MNERRFEEPQDLPIDARITLQMSYATIRYLYDAIVELVTNSDDSYKRLEGDGIAAKGEIKIGVRRLKGSRCERLEVIDFAEGMDKQKLEKALIFAGEASGFEEGKSVRGLFGRGLKEAIIALGKGEIYSIKNNKLSIAEVWIDERSNKPKRRLIEEAYIPSKDEREEIGITEGSGTTVRIFVTNDKIKCPDLKTFFPQIVNHYALRDINSAANRKVILEFESPEKQGLKMFKTISYETPKVKKQIADQSIKLPGYGDNIELRIYESDQQLESPYNNPFAQAGLLLKTQSAILDNQLFKYQSENAGWFFFGEVIWPNLAERLRRGETLLDLNRVGIEWRQEVCQVLKGEVEKILEPFIEEKRRQLEVKPVRKSERVNKLSMAICSLLNRLAKQHFSEAPIDTGPGPEKIEKLTIKPPYANLEIDKERPFSVYAPITIVGIGPGPYQAKVESNNSTHIYVLNPTVTLQPHRERPLLYYGNFRVVGKTDKEEAIITCKFGEHTATANVRVAPPRKIGPRKKVKTKGGFFRGIEADRGANPAQRVRYDEHSGIIWIYVKFPGISRYFEDNLDFIKGESSRAMYAELVGEAFCRFIARDHIDKGRVPKIPGAEIEAVTIATNMAQTEYLHQIHDAVLKQKL